MSWVIWIGTIWVAVLVVGGLVWALYRLAIDFHEGGRGRWRS